MPTWRNQLPPEGKNHGFTLKRTPTAAAIGGVITCDNFLVADTHWWHGRTTPCERIANAEGKTIDDTPCHPCREKIGYRTHVYLSAFDPKRSEHFIYECTCHAAKPFAEYLDEIGSLRGCAFQASRPKQTPNGQVHVLTHTANMKGLQLPQPPDLIAALCVIWRLPLTALSSAPIAAPAALNKDGYRRKRTTLTTKPGPLAEMRTQPDNEPDPPTVGEILSGNGHLEKQTAPK